MIDRQKQFQKMNEIEEKKSQQLQNEQSSKTNSFFLNFMETMPPSSDKNKTLIFSKPKPKRKVFPCFPNNLLFSEKEKYRFTATEYGKKHDNKFQEILQGQVAVNTSVNSSENHSTTYRKLGENLCKQIAFRRRLSGKTLVPQITNCPNTPSILSPRLQEVKKQKGKKKQEYYRSCQLHTTRPLGYIKREQRLSSETKVHVEKTQNLKKIFTSYTKATPDPIPMKRLDEVVDFMGSILSTYTTRHHTPLRRNSKT